METITRTKIVDVLKSEAYGTTVNVKGWVRTRRGSKQVSFIALNDGSTINNVQIVVDVEKLGEEYLKPITTGACISVNGELVKSLGQGQNVEIQATEIQIYGTADPATYPLQKKGHSLEFLREIAHLRPRTNTFGAVFRIRHNMAIAIHKFFHERGFFYFHTPIITASDCEGAGQMFQVTTMNLYDLKKDENGSIIYDDDFFGKQASLTVSGQLEGELAAMSLGAIYTFGPTFRAENSNTPRHLAEFWMIEPEVAFNEIAENMQLAEDFIKYCIQWALDNCMDDIQFLNNMFDKELAKTDLMLCETATATNKNKQLQMIARAILQDEYGRKQFLEKSAKFEKNYEKKIKIGFINIIIIPLVFLILMFSLESKLVFLILWILSIIILAVYLICVEYIHNKIQKQIKVSGFTSEDFVKVLKEEKDT